MLTFLFLSTLLCQNYRLSKALLVLRFSLLCSESEAVDQPHPSGHAEAGDGKEYTQIPSLESVNLSKLQEPVVPSQNKGKVHLFTTVIIFILLKHKL